MEGKKLLLMLCLCSSGVWAGDNITELIDKVRLKNRDNVTCTVGLKTKYDLEKKRIFLDQENFLRVTAAACQKFNCGSVVHLELIPDLSTSLLSCSESIRLVNGTNRCSGRLEVKTDQTWSSVCQSDFDHQDAEVVCRELSCGAPSLLHGASYGGAESPTWKKEFLCTGDERHLLDCDSSTPKKEICSSAKWTELTCSEFVGLRLEGGSQCSGLMMVKKQGILAPVKTDNLEWIVREGNIICEQLGCGSFIGTRMEALYTDEDDPTVLWSVNTSCIPSTHDIEKCIKDQLEEGNHWIFIICSESIRLVNGMNRCSGRLEVKTDQTWSSVCQSDFDHQDAEVVCRELDCRAPSLLHGASYGGAESPTWKTEFLCTGDERHLLDCDSSTPKKETCSSAKWTELTCSDPVGLRLEGGSQCRGQMMVTKQGIIALLKTDNIDWIVREGNIICEQLGCGSFVETTMVALPTDEDVPTFLWSVNTSCIPSTHDIEKCIKDQLEEGNKGIMISCSESIRLVNGMNRCSGRLEVKTDLTWSSVCQSDFNHEEAEVVCRELSCEAPTVFRGGLYGEAQTSVWTGEFWCEGNETRLLDCGRSNENMCSPDKAVGISCSAPQQMRLVGEESHCAGTLEIKYERWWMPVKYQRDNLMLGNEVCRELGCGSAVLMNKTKASDRELWEISSSCLESSSSLLNCLRLGLLSPYVPVDVLKLVCTDLLAQPNITVSPYMSDVITDDPQVFHVLVGSDFTITCSAQLQYQGGFFKLLFNNSDSVQIHILPAVNHSAHFNFSAAGRGHKGDYTCVYNVHVYSHNFSSESLTLGLFVSAPLTELMIRLVFHLLALTALISTAIFYPKRKNQERIRRRGGRGGGGRSAPPDQETALEDTPSLMTES